MTTLYILVRFCIWVLGFFKLDQSGLMMMNLDAIMIALAPMTHVSGLENHTFILWMKTNSTTFSLESES